MTDLGQKFYQGPGILTTMSDEQRSKLIGDIVSLLLCSKLHRKYVINDIGAVFFPPLHLNQFRTYRNKKGNLVGLVTWAFLSDEVQHKYAYDQYSLKAQDFNGGDNGWIIDFIAPLGHAKMMVKDLKDNVFPGRSGKALRVYHDNDVRRVINLRSFKK